MTVEVEVRGPAVEGSDRVLTADAVAFVADLQRAFDGRRRELLDLRRARQDRFVAGELLVFPEKFRILERLSESALNDFHAIFRRAGRKHEGRPSDSECARHVGDLPLQI